MDGTVGLGGHAAAILRASAPKGRLLGIDLDLTALEIARRRLSEYKAQLTLAQGNFADLDNILETLKLKSESDNKVDGVLLDLGVSSLQLDTPERGFSFSHPGPLDMRMDQRQPLTAAEVINHKDPAELADIFKRFGEERWAYKIAQHIAQARSARPISTTQQFAEIVARSIPIRPAQMRIHPATRVFQALRIFVNDELQNLHVGIDRAVSVLKPGGRICIISFHSLEDRIVKERFRVLSRACICPPRTPVCVCHHKPSLQVLTKHPITPKTAEIQQNPRSRSAKLRVAVKICES